MQPENQPHACGTTEGKLPGKCAAMVFPYIAAQENSPSTYSKEEGLSAGTLFPGLHLPFFRAVKSQMNCPDPALCELMALDFAVTELGLYLDTHKDDQDAFALYRYYANLYQEGREKYEKQYGPLTQIGAAGRSEYGWLGNPWPWDYERGSK